MIKFSKAKPKSRTSKKKAQNTHFITSCRQRLGQVLDPKIITSQIKKGTLELIDKQSHRVSRYKYIFEEKEYMICYDTFRKQPITIFPYSKEYENNLEKKYFWWLSEEEI